MNRIAIYQCGHTPEADQKVMTDMAMSISGAGVISVFLDGEDRSAYQEMVADARAGQIDAIITSSIACFAPSTRDLLAALKELDKIPIWFAKENFWSNSISGVLLIAVLEAVADAA